MPEGTVGVGLCFVTVSAFVCLAAPSFSRPYTPEKNMPIVSPGRPGDRLQTAIQAPMEVLRWR